MRRRRGGRPGGGITESPDSTSITSTRPGGHCWSWGSSYCPRASLGGGQLVIVSIALWRVAEILTWYVKLLFDKGHRVFLEVERNFFFLIADALIFVRHLLWLLKRSRKAPALERGGTHSRPSRSTERRAAMTAGGPRRSEFSAPSAASRSWLRASASSSESSAIESKRRRTPSQKRGYHALTLARRGQHHRGKKGRPADCFDGLGAG
jgi:hypothetical protein